MTPRAQITWPAPTNPNGDTTLTYQVRQTGTDTLLYEGTATSTPITLTVNTENKTFEVRSTNKSKLWSPWSLPSNPIRAFQPPGAPTAFTLTPTGDGTKVRFTFNPAPGNGALPNEIHYRWKTNGAEGSISSGDVVSHGVFALGNTINVQLTAISTINGETSEGDTTTATVTPYGPPAPPTVTATRNTNGTIDLSWSSPTASNGRPITGVKVTTTDTDLGVQPTTGTRQQGDGPNQEKCITAAAINNEGQQSAETHTCATTAGQGNINRYPGKITTCSSLVVYNSRVSDSDGDPAAEGANLPECREDIIELTGWSPNTTVRCYTGLGKFDSFVEYATDRNGQAKGRLVDSTYAPGHQVLDVKCEYV